MTARVSAITVILAKDVREDDVEAIVNAIAMVKGVLKVTPRETNFVEQAIAGARIRSELREKLFAVLDEPAKET